MDFSFTSDFRLTFLNRSRSRRIWSLMELRPALTIPIPVDKDGGRRFTALCTSAIEIHSFHIQKGDAFTRPVVFITTNYHARYDRVSARRQYQDRERTHRLPPRSIG